jgi:hypothetical protein
MSAAANRWPRRNLSDVSEKIAQQNHASSEKKLGPKTVIRSYLWPFFDIFFFCWQNFANWLSPAIRPRSSARRSGAKSCAYRHLKIGCATRFRDPK